MKHREKIRMREAVRESENSHESTKVGAVLYFMKNKRVWFEPIRGWNQRNAKGKVVHAEEFILDGYTGMEDEPHVIPFMPEEKAQLYITKAPCFECCQLIVMTKIEKVVCPKPYQFHPTTGEESDWFESQMNGLQLLQKNGIDVLFMEISNDK